MKDFVGLKAKTYSSLIDDNSADKKSKGTKKCVIKRKLRFEHYENCLDATQLENEIKHLEKKKNKIDVDSHTEDYQGLKKNKKLILKTQQWFKSERHIFFTEKVNKVVLNANDDKRTHSINLVETYAYGMRKDLICEKETKLNITI